MCVIALPSPSHHPPTPLIVVLLLSQSMMAPLIGKAEKQLFWIQYSDSVHGLAKPMGA